MNRLAAMLKAKGKVDQGCVEALAEEADEPPDIHPETPKGRRGRIDIGPPPDPVAGPVADPGADLATDPAADREREDGWTR